MFGKKKTLRGQAAIEKAPLSARTLRGQAAMEYLMTYGWAILVILIVLAVLAFYLPQFLKAQDQCAFAQPGFTCGDSRPFVSSDAGGVTVAMNVFNQNGQEITITEALCTTESPANVATGVDITDRNVQTGASVAFDGGTGPNSVALLQCYRVGTTSRLTLSRNSDFRGFVVLWYRFANDPTTARRQVQATVTGTVN